MFCCLDAHRVERGVRGFWYPLVAL